MYNRMYLIFSKIFSGDGFSDLWPVTKFGILSGSISRVGGCTYLGLHEFKIPLNFGLDPTLFTISTFKRKQIQN